MFSHEENGHPWIPPQEALWVEPHRPIADPYNEDPYYPDPYAKI
jgi:hypothetical protein